MKEEKSQVPTERLDVPNKEVLSHLPKPVGYMNLPLNKIDIDQQIPSMNLADPDTSARYTRGLMLILGSMEIIGRVINPLVVCQKEDGRYWLLDGQIRYGAMEQKQVAEHGCIVFPAMPLAERVILRWWGNDRYTPTPEDVNRQKSTRFLQVYKEIVEDSKKRQAA